MPSPVETQYGDYRYHSRLGARWAVFFDLLGIRFQYRPIRYTLTDLANREWGPDFVLPDLERNLNDPDLPRQSMMVVSESQPSARDIESAMHISRCNPVEDVFIFVGPPTVSGFSCFCYSQDHKPSPVDFGQCQFCGEYFVGHFRNDEDTKDAYAGHYGCMQEYEFAKRFNIDSAFMDFMNDGASTSLQNDSPILGLARDAAQKVKFDSKDSLAALAGTKKSIALLIQNRCFASPELIAFTNLHAHKLSLDASCPRFDNPILFVHTKHKNSASQLPCPCRRCINERESVTEVQLKAMAAPVTLM
jgi:hypothetical protein